MDFLQLKKNLKKDFSKLKLLKIAILGDSSTQLLHQAIKGYGFEGAINFEIYEADYDQIEQEILTGSSGLYEFQPDYVLLSFTTQKLYSKFCKTSFNGKTSFADDHIQLTNTLLESINERIKTKVIYSNFIEINDFVFGNFGNKIESSFIFQLRKLNYELMKLAIVNKNVFINDVSSLNNEVGNTASFDSKIYINADFVYSLDFLVRVASNIVTIVLPQIGRLNKCLILDLDNTMWGGIIGDDGIENIQIGDLGIGKAFTRLQTWAKQLKQRGIILAVCSKNTESIAKEPFEKHPEMVLKLDDISIFVANWESKVANIQYIQSVLNIGFDSIVFLDDNPYERGLIRNALPDITVPELPEDPADYLDYVRNLNLFETASFSEEDLDRTKQYQEEAKRSVQKQSFVSDDDYLASLQMTSQVAAFDKFTIPRVAQLSQRSNQFNLRTIRYTEDDIARISESSDFCTLSFDLKDTFGDYGLISAVILKRKEDYLFIDTWIMSCRVLKRGMEEFVLNCIVHIAKRNKINKIVGEYVPTSKNGIVKEHYANLGFKLEDGYWYLGVEKFEELKSYIHEK